MPGLREYLKLKRVAVTRNRAAALEGESVSTFSASTSVAGRSGVRRTRIRDFEILTDSGPHNLGYDLGPSSPELFLASLSSCMTHNFLINAALYGLALDDVIVDVTADFDYRAGQQGYDHIPKHPHNIRYTIEVLTDAPRADVAAVLERVERECPIYNAVTNPVPVSGRLIVTESVEDSALDYENESAPA